MTAKSDAILVVIVVLHAYLFACSQIKQKVVGDYLLHGVAFITVVDAVFLGKIQEKVDSVTEKRINVYFSIQSTNGGITRKKNLGFTQRERGGDTLYIECILLGRRTL